MLSGVRTAPWREFGRTVGVPVLLAAIVTAGAPGWTTYRIHRGDTLTDIAKRYHTTVAKLIKANNLPGDGDLIFAGNTLKVPGAKAPAKTSTQRATKAYHRSKPGYRTVILRHRVMLGDTLWELAKKYDVSQRAIVRANKMRSSVVKLGGTLKIPVQRKIPKPAVRAKVKPKATAENSFNGRIYPPQIVQAANRNRAILAKRSVPSKAKTKAMIIQTAQAFDLDPALPLAVAWMESGWNQKRVSVANAIGVMQVLPSTGRWVSDVLNRKLDLLKPRDNVIAGVALLSLLTRAAPKDQAIAGYYQGLASVRKHGMSRDTKRYVKVVLALEQRFSRR